MRSINVYQDLADLVMDYVASTPDIYLEFDMEHVDIDLLMPQGDELFSFEVIYDNNKDEDVLVVAEGKVTHDFNLELEVLEK
jgi:hypothetical protein